MLGIQITGILFGLFMLYYSFLNFKKKEFKLFEFSTWAALWVLLIFVALFPNSLDFLIKNVLSLKRPLDFFIIIGFLFLILLTFFNFNATKKNRKKIEKIIGKIAVKHVEENKNE